jgi:hypothetical protein
MVVTLALRIYGGLKVVRCGVTLWITCHPKDDILVSRARLGGPYQDGVVSMGFDMLLQVLGALERLSAEVTYEASGAHGLGYET